MVGVRLEYAYIQRKYGASRKMSRLIAEQIQDGSD
jgi:hypothetical protein